MKRIFTPWRMNYLTTPRTDDGCIFCTAASLAPSEESLVLWKGEHILVMLNRYPYSNGHLMVAPTEHTANLYESSKSALTDLITAAAKTQRLLSEIYGPDGFNLGMNFGAVAGAGVAEHYHVHLVPRWGGDHNFMSVTADTRLIPEELPQTWNRLMPKFATFGSSL